MDRRRLRRTQRVAKLSIAKRTLTIKQPPHTDRALPRTLQLNVVYVKAVRPLCDVESVEWSLLTTEPLTTTEGTLRVVDIYRSRWLVDEYFKAIKTGCDFQKRQLQSRSTLLVSLGIFAPIAWSLLRLRAMSRLRPTLQRQNCSPLHNEKFCGVTQRA